MIISRSLHTKATFTNNLELSLTSTTWVMAISRFWGFGHFHNCTWGFEHFTTLAQSVQLWSYKLEVVSSSLTWSILLLEDDDLALNQDIMSVVMVRPSIAFIFIKCFSLSRHVRNHHFRLVEVFPILIY